MRAGWGVGGVGTLEVLNVHGSCVLDQKATPTPFIPPKKEVVVVPRGAPVLSIGGPGARLAGNPSSPPAAVSPTQPCRCRWENGGRKGTYFRGLVEPQMRLLIPPGSCRWKQRMEGEGGAMGLTSCWRAAAPAWPGQRRARGAWRRRLGPVRRRGRRRQIAEEMRGLSVCPPWESLVRSQEMGETRRGML